MGKIERLFCLSVQYAQGSSATRLPKLLSEICHAFDCNGCVVTRTFNTLAAGQVTHSFSRTGQRISDRLLASQIGSVNAHKSVQLINSPIDGGPALIARAESRELLLYRENPLSLFTQEDGDLAGALWRTCNLADAPRSLAPSKEILVDEDSLSPRVQQVLAHLLNGLAEKQIAVRLGISPHTVHVYVKDLYRQLGVNSRPQLLIRCLKPGDSSARLHHSVERYPR